MQLLRSPLSTSLKKTPQKNSLYFGKWNFLAPRLKNFSYFWRRNFLASYFSNISETFRPHKIKNPAPKKLLIFLILLILYSSKFKKLLYFRRKLPKPENQKFHIFCLLRENFSNISTKEVSYTFPYKGAQFSKTKMLFHNFNKVFFLIL